MPATPPRRSGPSPIAGAGASGAMAVARTDSASTTRGHFQPRLTLQTLSRGDGLLGLRALSGFGPRSAQVTVARIDWTYRTDSGLRWETPAPTTVLGGRAPATELLRGAWDQRETMQRDLRAEADARDALWASGLRPLPAQALQWRDPQAAPGHDALWSLAEEARFGDFWADEVPRLHGAGWAVVVRPGFAHHSATVDRWRLVIDPATGDELGRQLVAPPRAAEPSLVALRQPPREGSWMLSLGIDVDGESLDLAPLLADLIQRDRRWLDANEIAAMPDDALVMLRAPGGRRIEAPGAPLKVIVMSMLDLLTDPRRPDGPLQLSTWEAHRLDALRAGGIL